MSPDRFAALKNDLAAVLEAGNGIAVSARMKYAAQQCSLQQLAELREMAIAHSLHDAPALTERLEQYQAWESERQRDWQREEERRDRWSRIEAAAVAFFDPETVTPCQAVDYAEALVDEVDRRRAAAEGAP